MKALTLIQPWAYAIERLGKRVENRTWKPPAAIVGQRIAIHAGKTLDEDAVLQLSAEGYEVDRPFVLGAITCTAIVRGRIERFGARSGVEGFVYYGARGDTLENIDPLRPWFSGPIGWVLDDVVSLSSDVPCRGAQGLWTVPADIAAQVLAAHPVRP